MYHRDGLLVRVLTQELNVEVSPYIDGSSGIFMRNWSDYWSLSGEGEQIELCLRTKN